MLRLVVLGALCSVPARPASAGPDVCTGVGTVTCTGNQSAGVANPAAGTTILNVNSLTSNIAPANTVSGIFFQSAGGVTINSATAPFLISTSNAAGIVGNSTGNGTVTVTSAGNISTVGNLAFGILSLANGAGTATANVSGSTITTLGDFSHDINAFGQGSGALIVNSSNNILTTHGSQADGINAFTNGGGAVTVTSSGSTISANGVDAVGILAVNNGAGAINLSSTADTVSATGDGADAIFAISQGGGPVTVTSSGTLSSSGNGSDALVARSAGAGAVTVNSSGTISASGDNAGGIVARSDTGAITVNASSNISTTGNFAMAIGVRSAGAGPISVTSSGNISTAGDFSFGLGAITTGNATIAVNASDRIATTGTEAFGIGVATLGSGAVTVNSSAAISTSGPTGAFGIGAIALGGGPVSITSTGPVTASGANSSGIAAIATSGNVTINVNGGTVTGGTGAGSGVLPPGAGVVMVGGATNTLNNLGTITTVSGIAGTAVFGAQLPANTNFGTLNVGSGGGIPIVSPAVNVTGNNTVNNFGAMIGSVDLGGGTNAFNNRANGMFNAGATINLGAGNALTNAGSLSPGGSGVIQTTALTGNLVQVGTGKFMVDVTAAGQSDRLAVSGTAALGGGTVQVAPLAGNYGLSTTYTILTATGGVSGTFANATSVPAFLVPILSYDANDVFLTLTRNASFFSGLAQTFNQHAVAGALDTSAFGSGVVQAMLPLSTPQTLQALDVLSGEIHGSLVTTLVDDSRYMRGAVLGRLRSASYANDTAPMTPLGFAGPDVLLSGAPADLASLDPQLMAYQPIATKAAPLYKAPLNQDGGLVFWAQGFGAWGRVGSDGNAARTDRSLGGFMTGADRRMANAWRLGFATGYSHDEIRVNDRASSAGVDSFHVALYAGGPLGGFNVRTGAAFAAHDIATSRTVMFPGFVEAANANYRGSTSQIFGEVGRGYAWNKVAMEPFAGLAWVHVQTNGFAEAGGAGIAALNGRGRSDDVGYSSLGVRFATSVTLLNGMMIVPRAAMTWQHAFGNVTPSASLAFQSTATAFDIHGVPLARDAALVEAGANLNVTARATVGLFYSGQLASTVQDHAVKGKFSWNY